MSNTIRQVLIVFLAIVPPVNLSLVNLMYTMQFTSKALFGESYVQYAVYEILLAMPSFHELECLIHMGVIRVRPRIHFLPNPPHQIVHLEEGSGTTSLTP